MLLRPIRAPRHHVAMNVEQETLDRHYAEAVAIVSTAGYGANSLLRERLHLSYLRASFLIEALQDAGILGDELDEGPLGADGAAWILLKILFAGVWSIVRSPLQLVAGWALPW